MATAYAASWIVARSGNGAPPLVSGMAAAAASVTTPRIPAHDTTADSRGLNESPGGRCEPRRRRWSNRAVTTM